MDHHEQTPKKGIFAEIQERHIPFLFAFIGIFIFTLAILSWLGATPVPRALVEDTAGADVGTVGGNQQTGQARGQQGPIEQPVRIVARTISLDDKVTNPISSDLKVLDEALLSSVVRYPGSAYLGEEGNVVIFGHSSYLRVVRNQSYKAFNDIQKLKTGETITVYSGTTVYEYRVTSVQFAKAENFVIDLSGTGRKLTLVTCNSFATKSDRFVIEAEFVTSYPIAS
jgi:LPXTG-site transpeptidase (sortase) family protein